MWRTSSRRNPNRSSWCAGASVDSNTGRVMNRTGPDPLLRVGAVVDSESGVDEDQAVVGLH